MPIAHDAAAGADSGIAIKNTLSADDFRRMMNQMKGGAPTKSTQAATPASPMPAPTVPAEQNTDGAPLAANSKFTFENFVYGPENSHAYRSALKFAALADERGTCTSLFIYGKSGLGKTHLLLAIKNELAEKSPEIKVKYANSQAYLDDLMTEFDRQKKSNAPIMQAYHGVDVLIIDDIQNIIGKRASVDYFFQLMDEFIRNNKKVVIAADRAPQGPEHGRAPDQPLQRRHALPGRRAQLRDEIQDLAALLREHHRRRSRGRRRLTVGGLRGRRRAPER